MNSMEVESRRCCEPERLYRVAVWDEQPIVRFGLVSLIESQSDLRLATQFESVEALLEGIEEPVVDVLALEIRAVGYRGMELLRLIREVRPSLPVLVLSAYDEDLFAERALHAGASGYLSKTTSLEAILDGIRRVATGELVFSSKQAQSILARAVRGKEQCAGPSLRQLTNRELEVFEHLGRGFKTREIASHLFISVKTVETHQAHIKRKLGLSDFNQLLRMAVVWANDVEERSLV